MSGGEREIARSPLSERHCLDPVIIAGAKQESLVTTRMLDLRATRVCYSALDHLFCDKDQIFVASPLS